MRPASELPYGMHAGCGRSQFVPRQAFAEYWFQTPRSGRPFETLIQFYVRLNLCRCGR